MSPGLYRLYVTALVFVFTVVPFTWGVIESIATPATAEALKEVATGKALTVGSAGLLGALVFLGALRGPIMGQPFEISLRLASPQPRSRALLPNLLRSSGLVVIAFSYAATVLLAGLWRGNAIAATDVRIALLGVGACAITASLAWLAGQILAVRAWALVFGVLALGGIGVSVVPVRAATLAWILVALAIIALPAGPGMLNLVSGPVAVAQSQRWHAARSSLYIGDAAGAAALYRAVARRGRYWNAFGGGPFWWRTFRADAVAAARLPGGMLAGFLGVALATGLVLLAPGLSGVAGFASAAGGAALLYLSLAPPTARFKLLSDLHRSPPLLRFSTPKLVALHSVFPAAFALCAALTGAAVLSLVFPTFRTAPLAAICVLTLVLIWRGFNSAKGQLPPALLAPVDSPAGDLSGFNVAVWQTDALLGCALSGVLVTQLIDPVPQMLVSLALGSGIAWLWWRRLLQLVS